MMWEIEAPVHDAPHVVASGIDEQPVALQRLEIGVVVQHTGTIAAAYNREVGLRGFGNDKLTTATGLVHIFWPCADHIYVYLLLQATGHIGADKGRLNFKFIGTQLSCFHNAPAAAWQAKGEKLSKTI